MIHHVNSKRCHIKVLPLNIKISKFQAKPHHHPSNRDQQAREKLKQEAKIIS